MTMGIAHHPNIVVVLMGVECRTTVPGELFRLGKVVHKDADMLGHIVLAGL